MRWGSLIDEQICFEPHGRQNVIRRSAPLIPHGIYKYNNKLDEDGIKWIVLRFGTHARYSFCRLSAVDYWRAGYEPAADQLPDVREVVNSNLPFDDVLLEPSTAEIQEIIGYCYKRLEEAQKTVVRQVSVSKTLGAIHEDLELSEWKEDVFKMRVNLREHEYSVFEDYVSGLTDLTG